MVLEDCVVLDDETDFICSMQRMNGSNYFRAQLAKFGVVEMVLSNSRDNSEHKSDEELSICIESSQ